MLPCGLGLRNAARVALAVPIEHPTITTQLLDGTCVVATAVEFLVNWLNGHGVGRRTLLLLYCTAFGDGGC